MTPVSTIPIQASLEKTTTTQRAVLVRISRNLALAVGLFALLKISGWLFGISFVRQAMIGGLPMKVNTAVAFAMGAVSLLMFHRSRISASRTAGLCCAAVTFLFGALSFVEYAMHVNLGIDELIARDIPNALGTISPGRMAFSTTLSLMLISGALISLHSRWSFFEEAFAVASIAIALIMALGRFYGTQLVDGALPSSSVAISTAICAALLNCGILFARPYRGIMALVTDNTLGGRMARMLIPVAVCVPIFVGWLSVQGTFNGLFDLSFGIALRTFATVSVSVTLILIMTSSLKRSGEKMIAHEHFFRALIEHSADAVAMLDQAGLVQYTTPASESLTGYDPGEFIGHTVLELVHPADRAAAAAALERVMTAEDRTVSITVRVLHKTGIFRWMEVTGTNMLQVPSVKSVVLNYRDVTERVQAEQAVKSLNEELEQRVSDRTRKLEKANKELEAFSYMVSHDLRIPLQTIGGYAALLQEESFRNSVTEVDEAIEHINRGAEKMATLINELLALAHVGKQELTITNVDMEALAREVYKELEPQRAGRKICFSVGAFPPAHGDAALLRQALLNLLGNAIKYTRKNPEAKIELSSESRNGHVTYMIRDNGAGFDMAKAHNLFTPFSRMHSNADFEGTGVGLAIVERVFERHGGRVWAEAKEGEGAAFLFTIAG